MEWSNGGRYFIPSAISNTAPFYWPGPEKFYPRQVLRKFRRKMERLINRTKAYEVETPEGYEWKDGKEVSLKYEGGKFRVIP